MTQAQETASRFSGAFDANLDFPFTDPAWETFSRSVRCAVTSYTDLDDLTGALKQGLFDFSYLPSASLFFLRSAPYRGIASALTPITKSHAQSSVLVVAKSNPAPHWSDLRGKRLGYINTYCTTSYFAPSILLSRSGLSLSQFFDAFPVAAWQGQIDAVVAGHIDATMVYEDVWLARSENATNTRILASIDDLPTPPLIAHKRLTSSVADQLKSAMLQQTRVPRQGAIYAGFTDFQEQLMWSFLDTIALLPDVERAA